MQESPIVFLVVVALVRRAAVRFGVALRRQGMDCSRLVRTHFPAIRTGPAHRSISQTATGKLSQNEKTPAVSSRGKRSVVDLGETQMNVRLRTESDVPARSAFFLRTTGVLSHPSNARNSWDFDNYDCSGHTSDTSNTSHAIDEEVVCWRSNEKPASCGLGCSWRHLPYRGRLARLSPRSSSNGSCNAHFGL